MDTKDTKGAQKREAPLKFLRAVLLMSFVPFVVDMFFAPCGREAAGRTP